MKLVSFLFIFSGLPRGLSCWERVFPIQPFADSRAPFPRPLGPTTPQTLVKDAGVAIMGHVSRIDELSFSAMALVGQE